MLDQTLGNLRSMPRQAGLAAALALAPAPALATGVAFVTNGDDSGPGSLRHALEDRQASLVLIAPAVSTIEIFSTVAYQAEKALTIRGSGQTVSTTQNMTLLAVTEGADLEISDLSFEGPGGFSITNRGDLGMDAGKGIFVDVREDQLGKVELKLRNVTVRGVANHGIHVSDCSLADDCGGGGGGGGEGSPASIAVFLQNVTVDDAGNGKFDADGLRVDDRGAGGIDFVALASTFINVGADGVELDEGNDGHVRALTIGSTFSDNGSYCDPELLEDYLPDPAEAEFDESAQVSEADIPPAVNGSPDDGCFEREVDFFDSGFVDGYEFAIDVDDGIDLDEAGNGSLAVSMIRSRIDGNLDEGVDFDEADAGGIQAKFIRSHAADNADDGFKLSEADAGSISGVAIRSTSRNNGGKGFVFEEERDGDLKVNVIRSSTSGNDDSDHTGIEVVQEDAGTGTLKVRASDIADGIDVEGVEES